MSYVRVRKAGTIRFILAALVAAVVVLFGASAAHAAPSFKQRPILFVQGTRDAFGTPSQLLPIVNSLRPTPTLRIVADGDHSFKLARKDPAAQAAIYANVQQDVVAWIQSIIASGA